MSRPNKSASQTAQAEGELTQALGRLFALTEAYPELKADESFRQLQVELATLEWVTWWNERRLHGAVGDIPPAEYEAIYYRQHPQSKEVA